MGRGARAQHPNEASAAMARGARLKQTVASAYVGAHGEKYTDEALAQKAGVSVNTVRNLWQGRNAEISTLLGVATASGLSILDLLTAMQGLPPGEVADRRLGERRQGESVVATAVADAIREQTQMLERVLGRMLPEPEVVAALPPEVEAEVDELEHEHRPSRPQGSGRRDDGGL